MLDIVDEMRKEIINRSNYFEELTKGTKMNIIFIMNIFNMFIIM